MFLVLWFGVICAATSPQELSPRDRHMLQRAENAADHFVERFRQTLNFGVVWKESSSSNTLCAYRSTGDFSRTDLERLKPSNALLKKLFVAWNNFYYLKGAYSLSVARIYPDSSLTEEDILPRKALLAEQRLYGDGKDELDPPNFKNIEVMVKELNNLSRLYRKYMPRKAMQTAAWRANTKWLVNRNGIIHSDISNGHDDCVTGDIKVYTVDRGLFYFFIVEENGEMKVVGLAITDSV